MNELTLFGAIVCGIVLVVGLEICLPENPPITHRKKMRRMALILIGIGIGVVVLMLLSGCAGNMGYTQREMFNVEHALWMANTRPTAQNIDQTITVRIRAFGDERAKQIIFNREYPAFGTVQQCAINTNPPEIWMDIRENSQGEIVIAPHILGHEMAHILRFTDNTVHDPDK